MKGTLPQRVRLGVFEVDLRAGELRQDEGAVLILSDQPLQILRMLIEADGEIVTREDIQKKLWPSDTIVEFDHSINAAIRKLRRALVDSGDEPHYIGTIAKRGYRLLVPVERVGIAEDDAGDSRRPADPSAPSAADSARNNRGGVQAVAADLAAAAQAAPVIPASDESSMHPTFARSGTYLRWKWLAIAVMVCTAILAGVLYWRFKSQLITSRKTLSERLLTHNPSENPVANAAISPDGKYVAYIDNQGLHLSVIETGEIHGVPLREGLRTHLDNVAWFPDGENLILTAGSDAEGKMIWVTSVFGGVPHEVGSGGNWPTPVASPQGSSIAFVGRHDREIWVMGANGENPRKILAGNNERYGALAWSPTGQRLAYIRTAEGHAGGSIETLSLDGGPPSEVISDPQLVNAAPGLVWAHDGRMIFVKGEGSDTRRSSHPF